MNTNEENIYSLLHEFRNWDREWNDAIKKNPKSVDEFAVHLDKTWSLSKKKTQEFKWDDELVKEFVRDNFNRQDHNYLPAAIKQFKASKAKPLEYEILSFCKKKSTDDLNFSFVYIKTGDKFHFGLPDEGFTEQEILSSNEFYIYSVKRSDGEVFSIGDEVTYLPKPILHWNIDNFFIRGDGKMLARSYDNINVEILDNDLGKFIKKQPIRVTDDNVEVFEGGRFWFITPQYEVVLCSNAKDTSINAIATFHLEENADNYVLMNKPCLSVNDINDCMDDEYVFPSLRKTVLQKAVDLAKSKNL